MHQTHPDGSHIASFCDFCRTRWDPQTGPIMIEGHQGSLMCVKCVSAAYRVVSIDKSGTEHTGKKCTMCLEERDQPQWESPIDDDHGTHARACLRCIKQAATALEKDPDAEWKRPV